MTEQPDEGPQSGIGPGRGPGRPPGSVSLTPQIQEQVVSLIRSGVFDHVAAETVGIPARTHYEWIQRGEGRHPSRPPTPELSAYAQAVRTARAQARAVAEAKVFRENPLRWLSFAARSTRERPGWTAPPEEQEHQDPSARVAELIRRLDAAEGERRPADDGPPTGRSDDGNAMD